MLRNEWEFTYTAADLLAGARRKVKWHQSRFEFWKQKQEEIKKEMGTSGITIAESAGGISYMSSPSKGPVAIIDDKMQKHLNEAYHKTLKHKNSLNNYLAWVNILSVRNPASYLNLDHSDWLFFFSEVKEHQSSTEEEEEENF